MEARTSKVMCIYIYISHCEALPECFSAGKDILRVILHARPLEAVVPSTWKETPVTPGSPEAELRGHVAGAGSWKGSVTLIITHFLCPEQGAVAGVML